MAEPPLGPSSTPQMSPNGKTSLNSAPEPPRSAVVAALEHTGIPKSWLVRPKLPSRNWLIFIGVVSSISYLYWDDRRKCKAIRQEYVDKVKHLADAPLGSMEQPRKVQVYASKWPGDEEYDRSMKFFRKYVKPILVAAAIDFDMKNGNVHGAISDLVRDRLFDKRLAELGLEPYTISKSWLPKTPVDQIHESQREMEGGTIIIGRHTFKEYMNGLKRGWTEPLRRPEEEEQVLVNQLAEDHHFDEPEETPSDSAASYSDILDVPGDVSNTGDGPSTLSTPATLHRPPSSIYSPLNSSPFRPSSRPSTPQSISSPVSVPEHLTIPPSTIPPHPPLLLVYYPNRLGFLNVPMMIVDFFNERKKVKIGCEAAYRLVMNQTRDFIPPSSSSPSSNIESSSPSSSLNDPQPDTSFALSSEDFFRSSYASTPETIAKSRKNYYNELPGKLASARALARNTREPTKDEITYPPKTEVELREERLKKEKKWRREENAWQFLRAGRGPEEDWDERLGGEGVLKVFRDLTPFEEEEVERERQRVKEWKQEKARVAELDDERDQK